MTKNLTVPQSGTRRDVKSPLERMIHPETKGAGRKKCTSFSIDESLYVAFKKHCVDEGKSMSELLEELMRSVL